MYWIIQDNVHGEPFYEKLLSFLDRIDIPHETIKVVPFSGELIPEPTIPEGMHVMVIGSYSLAKKAIERGWIPGAFDNENYDYRVWSEKWGVFCLNVPGSVYNFGSVPKQHGDFFMRPSEDTKAFTGQVFDWDEFEEWRDKVINLGETYTSLDAHTPVVVSDPKKIHEEYRFIVVDGKVITGSLYKVKDTGIYKECDHGEAWDFAQIMSDIWCPSRVFALDLALHDGKFWVLEMGCMNAAGLYHCDIQKIVMALEDMNFDGEK